MPGNEKQAVQQRLRDTNSFTHQGNGPGATRGSDDDSAGWAMSPELYFRCAQCDYFMSGDPSESDQCFCGAMSKDADYGRFGSDLGDAQIEVFRAEPRRARWRYRLKRDEK